jgi:hypothetical protein
MLTIDDFDFIITTVNDTSQEIFQKHEAKEEEMYNRVEVELRGLQQALQSSRAVFHPVKRPSVALEEL